MFWDHGEACPNFKSPFLIKLFDWRTFLTFLFRIWTVRSRPSQLQLDFPNLPNSRWSLCQLILRLQFTLQLAWINFPVVQLELPKPSTKFRSTFRQSALPPESRQIQRTPFCQSRLLLLAPSRRPSPPRWRRRRLRRSRTTVSTTARSTATTRTRTTSRTRTFPSRAWSRSRRRSLATQNKNKGAAHFIHAYASCSLSQTRFYSFMVPNRET